MIKHTITKLYGPTQTFVLNRSLTASVEHACPHWYVCLDGFAIDGCGATLQDALRDLGSEAQAAWAENRHIASRLKNVVERVEQ